MHEILLDIFTVRFRKPPKSLVLDFDAISDQAHRHQEGRHFYTHYSGYYFLPLLRVLLRLSAGSGSASSELRQAFHAATVLKLLVRRLQKA